MSASSDRVADPVPTPTALIGVDAGGTFTDVVLVDDAGTVTVGKAFSTPDRPADGVMLAIADAARTAGIERRVALSSARLLAHGTTVGVNALLTRSGARVGLLTTAGFEDTLAIARIDKTTGLPQDLLLDPFAWRKPEPLVARGCIRGIVERVDRWGEVVVPIDEESAVAAIDALRELHVGAVAISLLWGFANPVHEQRLAEIVAERLPGVHVTLASELAPRLGEYERTTSAVLNAYIGPIVARYLQDLDTQLRGEQFGGSLFVTQSTGGVQQLEQVVKRPLDTVWSGPVGGLGAAAAIGRVLGHRDIITSDVGGTSFDVGLVVGGALQYARRPTIGQYAIATPVVDVESIGTGGGSIVWIDPYSGGLRVGPRSAGASPGPVCYGRGGTEPTVTDAAVVLGLLDRLGSEIELDAESAEKAVLAVVAEPLGLDPHEASEAIVRVACAQMADLVRRVTVQRGHDPRTFVLYAFGGAAPQYAARYAAELGVSQVVVPANAAVFSAYGAVASDVHTSAELELPAVFPPPLAWLEEVLDRLEHRVRTELAGAGDPTAVVVERSATLRFRRQVHALRVPLPPGRIDAGTLDAVAAGFEDEYQRVFGPGTAYTDAGIEFVGVRVEATIPMPTPVPRRPDRSGREPTRRRRAWFGGSAVECPVYDGATLSPELTLAGPAFVELPTTCIVIPPGDSATIDDMGNVTIAIGARA